MAAEGGRRRQKGGRVPSPCRPLPPVAALGLHVVVQEELVRMRPQRHGIDFLGALVREPGLDQVGREHSTLEADHAFLLEGGVFTPDLIETWLAYKRAKEVDPVALRPHPYE